MESWILADVNSIARWKLGDNTKFSLKIYHNTAKEPWEPKKEILKLARQAARHAGKKEPRTFNPEWIAEVAKKVELSETTLEHNCSLRCFYDLVKGCADIGGQQYFADYPQAAHCESQEIPDS